MLVLAPQACCANCQAKSAKGRAEAAASRAWRFRAGYLPEHPYLYDYLTPAEYLDYVDSRIESWNIRIVDTVADNASCGVFVLGDARVDPRPLDLAALRVKVRKNGQPLSEGVGAAVQGSPLASVAWLANTLGAYGVSLDAGEVILSGSLVPLETARPGDRFEMDLEGVGSASIAFA